MNNFLLVFLGGGIGSVLRYATGQWLISGQTSKFPFTTLSVNLLASFVLGFIAALALLSPGNYEKERLLLGVGFCGGLSTFSTFTGELFELLRGGDYTTALLYSVGSMLACLLAFASAHYLLKSIT